MQECAKRVQRGYRFAFMGPDLPVNWSVSFLFLAHFRYIVIAKRKSVFCYFIYFFLFSY